MDKNKISYDSLQEMRVKLITAAAAFFQLFCQHYNYSLAKCALVIFIINSIHN